MHESHVYSSETGRTKASKTERRKVRRPSQKAQLVAARLQADTGQVGAVLEWREMQSLGWVARAPPAVWCGRRWWRRRRRRVGPGSAGTRCCGARTGGSGRSAAPPCASAPRGAGACTAPTGCATCTRTATRPTRQSARPPSLVATHLAAGDGRAGQLAQRRRARLHLLARLQRAEVALAPVALLLRQLRVVAGARRQQRPHAIGRQAHLAQSAPLLRRLACGCGGAWPSTTHNHKLAVVGQPGRAGRRFLAQHGQGLSLQTPDGCQDDQGCTAAAREVPWQRRRSAKVGCAPPGTAGRPGSGAWAEWARAPAPTASAGSCCRPWAGAAGQPDRRRLLGARRWPPPGPRLPFCARPLGQTSSRST